MRKLTNTLCKLGLLGSLFSLTACSTVGNYLNPFYEPPAPQALLGEMTDKALYDGGGNETNVRQALDSMATYRRGQLPQPADPVVQPAIVRLMWVPDHLNKSGDLVPAHYYYLKVLHDRWAVTDAFELEQQLNATTGGSKGSNIPYVTEDDSK